MTTARAEPATQKRTTPAYSSAAVVAANSEDAAIIEGAPVLAVEILSPSTREYDRGDKFRFYQSQSTLREYILVDSQSVLVEHFTKTEQGWTLQKFDQLNDILRIGIAGVEISLKAIYEKVTFLGVARG